MGLAGQLEAIDAPELVEPALGQRLVGHGLPIGQAAGVAIDHHQHRAARGGGTGALAPAPFPLEPVREVDQPVAAQALKEHHLARVVVQGGLQGADHGQGFAGAAQAHHLGGDLAHRQLAHPIPQRDQRLQR